MAKYGPHRTYKVHQIKWNMNPKDYIFDHGDEKARSNMIDYFRTAYGVKIHSVNQPLFEISRSARTSICHQSSAPLSASQPKSERARRSCLKSGRVSSRSHQREFAASRS